MRTTLKSSLIKTFSKILGSDRFALLGQLRLHQDNSREQILEQANELVEVVDAISVTDCPNGILHMSGLAISAILLTQGIDPVLQFSTRDRNRLALKSELLGAAALGVTSFMLYRGDKLPKKEKPKLSQNFDTGAKRFISMANQLSNFHVSNGNPRFMIGTLATAFRPEKNWTPIELQSKAKVGASFIQTQICLDADLLRQYVKFLVAAKITWNCKIVVSIPVLNSADSARWLYENLRGSVVPESVVEEFEQAANPEQFGIEFAARLINEVKQIPGIDGANLSTTGEPSRIVEAVKLADPQL